MRAPPHLQHCDAAARDERRPDDDRLDAEAGEEGREAAAGVRRRDRCALPDRRNHCCTCLCITRRGVGEPKVGAHELPCCRGFEVGSEDGGRRACRNIAITKELCEGQKPLCAAARRQQHNGDARC